MATGLFLLSITTPLVIGFCFVLSYCFELSSRLRRYQDECRKLRISRDGVRQELEALRNDPARSRTPFAGQPGPPIDDADRFRRLRALVIKALHPDNAPPGNALEKTLRSEMFKMVWPEIIRIENDTHHRPGSVPQDPAGSRPTAPADHSETLHAAPPMPGRRRYDPMPGWRQRTRETVRS
jgi:hypothetical protein